MRGLCFSVIIVMIILAHYCQCGESSISSLGVNWGALASHPLDPGIVVQMLKDNGIKKVKLFDADSWTVSAFYGTDIQVILGIPNDQLQKIAHNSRDAEHWVKENVTKHLHDDGVNIKYVAVGNEPFLSSYNGSYVKVTYPAMVNIQSALEKAGHADTVKVTTPMNADVYESSSNKPSDGQFRDDISGEIKQILSFLNDNKSPFMVNIYPFLSLYQVAGFPGNFAYFDDNAKPISDENNVQYTNVFDANFDTLIYALKKVGFPNLSIQVGEVGWPTDGDHTGNANPSNAQRFYKGLMKKVANKKGTPLHPEPTEMYLFSLFDEDLKSIAPGSFERHWGIFRYDGRPKFRIDFSGEGEDKWPVGVKGVKYQERQWCVVKSNVRDESALAATLGYACANADCTSLGANCSCMHMDLVGQVSYAFNQFFQARDQDVEACDFKGMATIVKQDPSKGTCFFPVEIVSGGVMLHAVHYLGGILVCFLFMFVTLA
ncbi:glucan endo-1,3-beta-glucosidase 8-like [Prosopis cineraria]|uniref:glucan endo-1,3-beta-glucosidase 8-like n=1 Tax=Prosopis cineraria TaxID=364024 RepID=UPI00240F1837|nr:glucan endo-1,3-beta-glucosidase 8-like [Prosopis cineraria]